MFNLWVSTFKNIFLLGIRQGGCLLLLQCDVINHLYGHLNSLALMFEQRLIGRKLCFRQWMKCVAAPRPTISRQKVSKLVQVQEYHYLARNEHIAFCHVTFLYTLCDDGGCCLHRKHVHLGFLYSKCNNTRKEISKKATHSSSSDFLTCGKKKICVSAGKMFFIVGSYPAPVSGVCFKMMH